MRTVRVHVLKAFYDLVARKNRNPGDVFDASEKRAAYIDDALPGYIEIDADAEDAISEDALKKMTMPQLAELAKRRGIELSGRPKKAELIQLLTKE